MGLLKIQSASKVFLAAQSDTEQKVSLETTDTKSLVQSHFPSRKLGTRVPVLFLRTPPPTHVSRSFPRPSVKHTQMFRVRASRSSPSGGGGPASLFCGLCLLTMTQFLVKGLSTTKAGSRNFKINQNVSFPCLSNVFIIVVLAVCPI